MTSASIGSCCVACSWPAGSAATCSGGVSAGPAVVKYQGKDDTNHRTTKPPNHNNHNNNNNINNNNNNHNHNHNNNITPHRTTKPGKYLSG